MRTIVGEEEQRHKHHELLEFIRHEKLHGRDVVFHGARKISLRINGNEGQWRSVSNRSGMPIYRENGQLRLSNWDYEAYLALLAECGSLNVVFKAEVLRRKPYEPAKKTIDLATQARLLRNDAARTDM